MPEKVSLKPTSKAGSVIRPGLSFIPRRHDVLQTLTPGQRLSVLVLENFGGGKVMLEIKGAAVTAQANGEFPIGGRIEVQVNQDGRNFILQRVATEDTSQEESLMRLLRVRLPGLADRNQALVQLLTGSLLDGFAGAKTGLAELYSRLSQMLGDLFQADTGLAEKLQMLAVTMGLAPLKMGERIREFLGKNLPGLLDKILSASKDDYLNLLRENQNLAPEDTEKLTQLVGGLKEQIALFRGLNALFESRGLPVHLQIPFVFQGEPQPTELWIYKKQGEGGKDAAPRDPEVSTALIRLRLSQLGEIRAQITVLKKQVQVGIYAEREKTAALVEEALPELQADLSKAGLEPNLAVRVGLDLQPVPTAEELFFTGGEKKLLSVKA